MGESYWDSRRITPPHLRKSDTVQKTEAQIRAEIEAEAAALAETQKPGQFKLNTDVSDEDAKKGAAQVTREQFERYMNEFVPAETSTIDSLGQGGAQQRGNTAAVNAERSRKSLERMRSRYGTFLTGRERQAENSQAARTTKLSELGGRNTGREIDENRDFSLRAGLLNLGNNLNTSAVGGLTDAATNAQGRESAYQQAKASHSAAKSQQTASTIGTVASLAAMAFF